MRDPMKYQRDCGEDPLMPIIRASGEALLRLAASVVALMAAFSIGLAIGLYAGQAQAAEETFATVLTIHGKAPDPAKLEVKAIDVLVARYGLTREEARAKVRVNGFTDVQRCVDYIVMDFVNHITQIQATAVSMIVSVPKSDQQIPPVAQPTAALHTHADRLYWAEEARRVELQQKLTVIEALAVEPNP